MIREYYCGDIFLGRAVTYPKLPITAKPIFGQQLPIVRQPRKIPDTLAVLLDSDMNVGIFGGDFTHGNDIQN